jgi:hypothetical protein
MSAANAGVSNMHAGFTTGRDRTFLLPTLQKGANILGTCLRAHRYMAGMFGAFLSSKNQLDIPCVNHCVSPGL